MNQHTSHAWTLRVGRPEPPPQPAQLQAGPVRATLRGIDLHDVRVGGFELVRLIGVRVRDEGWNTIAATVTGPQIDVEADRFTVRFEARHAIGQRSFAWQGTIAGDSAGRLHYLMEGRAESEFLTNRVGLCVLHPIAATAGRRFRASGPAGALAGQLPELIGPQLIESGSVLPLVPAFDELEVEAAPGLIVRFAFDGDVFEIEDQRNWTDASFKTYSTPVGLPTPRRLTSGEAVRQAVHLEFSGRPATLSAGDPPSTPEVTLGPALGRFPPLGMGVDCVGADVGEPERARLARLGLAHLRTDVELGESAAQDVIRAHAVADAAATRLELALVCHGSAAAIRAGLREIADAVQRAPVARLIVRHAAEPVTSSSWNALVRENITLDAGVPLLGGTDHSFVELNRGSLPLEGFEGVAYAINAQVHDSDDALVMQTPDGQAATVATARALAPGRSVHVSPLTLQPRSPVGLESSPQPVRDPRLMSLFAAAWFVASVEQLLDTSSLTAFEATGPHGVLERTASGSVAPVCHVLSALAAWRGAPLLTWERPAGSRVAVLAVRRPCGLEALLANTTPDPCTVRVRGLSSPAVGVRYLDEHTAGTASVECSQLPGRTERLDHLEDGVTLLLRPYAVAHLRSSCDEAFSA